MKLRYLIVLVVGLILLSGCVPQTGTKAVPCSGEYNEALRKMDVTICESATGPTKEYCRDNCVKEVAYLKGEAKLCELINPNAEYVLSSTEKVPIKDFCYMHLAQKLNDVSLCDNVETDWAKENCPKLS